MIREIYFFFFIVFLLLYIFIRVIIIIHRFYISFFRTAHIAMKTLVLCSILDFLVRGGNGKIISETDDIYIAGLPTHY